MSEEIKKKPSPPQKKVKLSHELAAFMGATEATRPEVVKALWVHIKKVGAQAADDKRFIVPDAVLAPLLGAEKVHMTAMMKPLNKHFVK